MGLFLLVHRVDEDAVVMSGCHQMGGKRVVRLMCQCVVVIVTLSWADMWAVQVELYLSQLADRNAELKDTACLCISELSQKVMMHLIRCCSLSLTRCLYCYQWRRGSGGGQGMGNCSPSPF